MDARRLPARHGVLWLLAGFALFRRNPPLMTLLTFSYLLAVIVINLIPRIGPLILPLLLPTMTVILANGCRTIEQGRMLGNDALGAGIAPQRIGLAKLGGLHLVGSSLLVLGASLIGEPVNLGDGLSSEEMMALTREMAILLVLASPLLMAFWFAPLLTAWDGVSAAKSLFFSFVASWRNWRAFAMYALAIAVVGAVIPGLILIIAGQISQTLLNVLNVAVRMMVIFVLAPTMVATVYLSYRDVFAASETPPPADE